MCFLCKSFTVDQSNNHSKSLEKRLIIDSDQNLLNPSLTALIKKEDAYYSGFSGSNTFDSLSGSTIWKKKSVLMRHIRLLIFDECHHCGERESYRLIMDEFYRPDSYVLEFVADRVDWSCWW